MKIIASRLLPKHARTIAKEHNDKYHAGWQSAFVFDDIKSDKDKPRYRVLCAACQVARQSEYLGVDK